MKSVHRRPVRPHAIALAISLLLVAGSFAACNEEALPEGQADVPSLCAPYRAVASQFPFDVPPDLNNPGENLRARDAIEQLEMEVAALHDAVRISQDTQAARAFDRYASEVGSGLDDARSGTSGLSAPSEWLRYRDELNAHEADAHQELRDTLESLGVNLRTTCDL